jgi:hypothetical protein
MFFMNNENGSALIYALLTITVISLLSLLLIGKVLSTNMQVHRSEEAIQAYDLTEMGLKHFKHVLLNYSDQTKNSNNPEQDYVHTLNSYIGDVHSIVKPIAGENYFYKVDFTIENNGWDLDNGKIFINYTITGGNESNETRRTLQSSQVAIPYPIIRPSNAEPDLSNCDSSSDDPCNVYYTDNSPIIIENQPSPTIVNHFYSKSGLVLSGGSSNNQNEVIVEGDLHVQGTSTLHNHTVITTTNSNGSAHLERIEASPNSYTIIKGNAYIYDGIYKQNGQNIDTDKKGNTIFFCVEGTLNLHTTSNLQPSDIRDLGSNNCDTINSDSGIYARDVNTFSGSFSEPTWVSEYAEEFDLNPSYE